MDQERITEIALHIDEPADQVIDAAGDPVLPGFTQSHIHLYQSLFSDQTDDQPLVGWLNTITGRESRHTPESLNASARLDEKPCDGFERIDTGEDAVRLASREGLFVRRLLGSALSDVDPTAGLAKAATDMAVAIRGRVADVIFRMKKEPSTRLTGSLRPATGSGSPSPCAESAQRSTMPQPNRSSRRVNTSGSPDAAKRPAETSPDGSMSSTTDEGGTLPTE